MSENKDFVIENGVLKKYNGPGGAVVIPEGVVSIAPEAIWNQDSITELFIPQGCHSVEMNFNGCSGLRFVRVPASVTYFCPLNYFYLKQTRMELPVDLYRAIPLDSDAERDSYDRYSTLLYERSQTALDINLMGPDGTFGLFYSRLVTDRYYYREKLSLACNSPDAAGCRAYDEQLSEEKPKFQLLGAMGRLYAPWEVTQEHRETFETLVRDNAAKCITLVLNLDDAERLSVLVGLKLIHSKNYAKTLKTAGEKGSARCIVYLEEHAAEIQKAAGPVKQKAKQEKPTHPTQVSIPSPENPVEQLVRAQWKVTPTVKKLQKLVKQGVRCAGSEEVCSKEALIWLVAYPVDAQGESEYKTQILQSIQQNLDPIAAGLDRAALMEFLDMMVFSGTNIKLFIPAYCRYADEEQMGKLVKQMKAWHQWSVYGATGRNYENCAQENLYYSETKAAMRACNLRSYAAMRGTDEQTLRDTVLADLGLDREGKKYYDLGNKTVEARMEEDLTLTLYDPEAGKVVKSMPKKGADPEKYEAAKKDFARLKKDIRAAVKERVNLLFQRFLDGEGQKGEDWKKVYFQNPMLNQIARLLVWSQNRKTFIMTAQGTVDAAGQPYEMGDKPVKVAHPMEMSKKDLAHWQKYFTSHSLKQPFEQVWEPVVDFSAVREDRYQGLTLPANQLRSQDKHGIYFNYDNGLSELTTGFADLDLECDFTQFQRHWMDPDARVVFGKLEVRKESRAANHVLVKLDRWLAAERVRKDDATVVDVLDSFTLAQVTELLNLAIGNQCTNCTAALLEYKNQRFPDFDPMDVFTLE